MNSEIITNQNILIKIYFPPECFQEFIFNINKCYHIALLEYLNNVGMYALVMKHEYFQTKLFQTYMISLLKQLQTCIVDVRFLKPVKILCFVETNKREIVLR